MDLERIDSTKHRGGLADFIRARTARIVEQWEASERPSHALAESMLDHVGELLLRAAAQMEKKTRRPFSLDGIDLRAQPAEICAELALLRTAVVDAWIDDGGGRIDAEDVCRFGRAIDDAIVAAVGCWSDGTVRREVTTGEHPAPSSVFSAAFDPKEMAQLVALFARELRAPLHAIAFSMAKVNEDFQLPEAVRITMQKTARGAERMVEKIDDVLDFATVRLRGGIEVTRRAVNMVDVARGVLEREDAAPGARRTRLHAEGDTTGVWDRDRLAQLVARLVVNARRHGEASAALEVHVRGMSDAVELHVVNRGTLEQETLAHLFQPFRPRDAQRGLGLGLFLVDAIARAHQGTVSASSSAGSTSFVVRLPRAPW